MTAREVIVKEIEELPDECLGGLADYVERLRRGAALQAVPTALATEAVLAEDWLRPKEDEAWRDL